MLTTGNIMDINQVISILRNRLNNEKWFSDIKAEDHNKIIVYTHWQNMDILQIIPEFISGYHICVHFAPNKKYSIKQEKCSADYLRNDMLNLISICGLNILESIFYECHDKKNAITNLSSKFPQVREKMDKLYDKYGFDMIFNLFESFQ